jgi:hypothetical protein
VAPSRYTVTFADGEAYQYEDHVPVRPRFAYYRFDQGVVAYGPPIRDLPEADVSSIFRNAGMTDSEQRIARAVSVLEGGFESVNTYDTGCVSVGFSAPLARVEQDLSAVSWRMKRLLLPATSRTTSGGLASM